MWPNGGGMYRQTSLPPATHYSIDVECVATGVDHNARDVAQISLVVCGLLPVIPSFPGTLYWKKGREQIVCFLWDGSTTGCATSSAVLVPCRTSTRM